MLSIVGVLAVVGIPQVMRSTGTARGSALVGCACSVQVAFTAANAPDADVLTLGAGVVPEAFRASLKPDHIPGEAGVQLTVVGEQRDVWLRLVANAPEGLLALDHGRERTDRGESRVGRRGARWRPAHRRE